MNFRTAVTLKPSPYKIQMDDRILTLGSCFAQSIGQKFLDHKLRTLINPFGTTYHPLSIHKLLHYALYHEYPPPHTYLENAGVTFNYDFHSSFHGPEQANLQKQLQECIGVSHYFLKNCRRLIITYGTAWIYERVDTGEAVANCHKMPSAIFAKRMATVAEMVDSFKALHKALETINPALQIILTVSPVRHIKDTLSLNSVSKSALRLACHELSEQFTQVDYFPAYEIMMDDLRDYRFYETDMIHPSEVAEDYIWEKFCEKYFEPSTLQFFNEWTEIRKALAHRPFHPEGNAHQDFLKNTMVRLEAVAPIVDVAEEISQIKSRLISPV